MYENWSLCAGTVLPIKSGNLSSNEEENHQQFFNRREENDDNILVFDSLVISIQEAENAYEEAEADQPSSTGD